MSDALERCGWFPHLLGRAFLAVFGWRAIATLPHEPRVVVIAAPHTSNWDLVYALAFAWGLGLRIRFLIKDAMFVFPFGAFFRALGGIPVDRSAPHGAVEALAAQIRASERITLLVPPEGTRARREHWKSGFYHIARAADVPVVCCAVDYANKAVVLIETFRLSGDMPADMAHLRAVFAPYAGLHPELASPVRLANEE